MTWHSEDRHLTHPDRAALTRTGHRFGAESTFLDEAFRVDCGTCGALGVAGERFEYADAMHEAEEKCYRCMARDGEPVPMEYWPEYNDYAGRDARPNL
jgi:hypothetical protein